MQTHRAEQETPSGDGERPRRIVIVAPPGYDLTGASDTPFWVDLWGPDLDGDPADLFDFLRWDAAEDSDSETGL